MECTEIKDDRIQQLRAYNNDLGDVLQETAALTHVLAEMDMTPLKVNTQQQLFMIVDDKLIDAVSIQRNMTELLETMQ